MQLPINSERRPFVTKSLWATPLIALSALIVLSIASSSMHAQTQNQAASCSLEIIRTTVDNLHQYQLHLECPETGETVHYRLEVNKQGKSGTSRNQQSGSVSLDHPQLVVGNLKINESAEDDVIVKGEILNQANQIIAGITRDYSAKAGE